ncbi:MAG: hypothetical protein WA294_09095 [Acidobacteriaceae bacterium]
MSYLDFPRLIVSGSFYTDPSTMDNDPSHYDPDNTNPAPWQDPGGSHNFSFQDILAGQLPNRNFTPPKVSSAFDPSGNVSLNDPIVNTEVHSTDTPGGLSGVTPSPAKMVDLDVYQQAVSTIYGFFLQLGVGANQLVGPMDAATLNSVRFDRVLPTRGWAAWDSYGAGSFGGDTYASGVFQSVVRIPSAAWPSSSGSPILDQLRGVTTSDSSANLLLSVRMTLDGYQNVGWHHEDFRLGRLNLAIGPVLAGEPTKCIAGRWLNGYTVSQPAASLPWNQPSLYGAPFRVRQGTGQTATLSIDLSNAIMMASPGGVGTAIAQQPAAGPLDLGNLSVYIGDGSTGVVGQPFQLNDVFYSLSGGIVDLPLTPAQQAAAAKAPFFIVSSIANLVGLSTFNGLPVLWVEDPGGVWIAANDRAFQLASDTPGQNSATASVYVTQWGQPVTEADFLACGVSPCFPGNGAATVPWSAGYKGNSFGSEAAMGLTVSYVSPGLFQLDLKALADPGSRTTELDSQLYFLCVWPASGPPPSPNLSPNAPPQEALVSCVLWASYQLNPNPQFPEIQQIFNVYNKLFPSMRAKMDLTEQQTVFTFSANPPWGFFASQKLPGPSQVTLPNGGVIKQGAIPYYMSLDIDDPRFMPIMRNLSPNKLLTYLYYAYNVQQGLIPTPPPPKP